LHNHFAVNGKKVNIPSYRVKAGDTVAVKPKSANLVLIHSSLKAMKETPDWLAVDKVKLTGLVVRVPERSSIPSDIQEQLVVELYSR